MGRSAILPLFLFLFLHCVSLSTARRYSIGVNYGTLGNNLPPPAEVARFLVEKTTIDQVKLFDTNPDILRAFANTNISFTVTVPNGEIPYLTKLPYARKWVQTHIAPFYRQTRIRRIAVGNEILHSLDYSLIKRLVPAMRTLHTALVGSGIRNVQVSSPSSLAIMLVSSPPSAGQFRPGWDRGILAPMLQFLRETRSVFMVNPYPYFGFSPETLNFALFKPNPGLYDPVTRITYTNSFDALLDSVYSAMKKLGYGDVKIVVAETGWPSLGDPGNPFTTVDNALSYNGNLIRHVNSRKGTPLMPGKKFETFIFGLFNENMKPGPEPERNFGLFRPDFTPVYNAGVMRGGGHRGRPGGRRGGRHPGRGRRGGKMWCVPKQEASDQALQANIDYVCSKGVDCRPIQAGGACFNPTTVRAHATYAMNAYYQRSARQAYSCDFSHTGVLTRFNPSHDACRL